MFPSFPPQNRGSGNNEIENTEISTMYSQTRSYQTCLGLAYFHVVTVIRYNREDLTTRLLIWDQKLHLILLYSREFIITEFDCNIKY